VRAPLDLDQGRDRVVVDERVIERPALGAVELVGQAGLAADRAPGSG